MILDKIIAGKRAELMETKSRHSLQEMKARAAQAGPSRDFKGSLRAPGLSLVAEIKKASPSAGIIRDDFDAKKIAKIYEAAGASAISVITEEKHFLGNLDYLSLVKRAVSLPILRKDFIIDEYQIYESKVFGADAILLIAAVLKDDELKRFIQIAEEIGLATLVEVHSEDELKRAFELGAQVIGINNRDLNTFKVDIETTFALNKLITSDKIVVAESGVKSREDILSLEEAKVDAVLIGEALMRSGDIGLKIDELFKETIKRS
ncbi:MAG: indole-3-glycerol phosphate synthase TrpC [Actinomycetota bacterium]|nr:indole-3-glycerol phosphate synthase TrpC [Actinomycetota bacterium]